MSVGRGVQTHRRQDVSTAGHVRLSIFQPTRRPTLRESIAVQTQWGECVVTGVLGQQHLDLLECAFDVAICRGQDEIGRYCLVIDPYRLGLAMGSGRSAVPSSQIRACLTDLRTSSLTHLKIYNCPAIGVVSGGILETVMYEDVGERRGPSFIREVVNGAVKKVPVKGSKRQLWKIPFSLPWTRVILGDLSISYAGRLRQIVALRHGVNQAIARFMLSHRVERSTGKNVVYSLNTALEAVGSDRRTRHHRLREMKDEQEKLASLNVFIDLEKQMIWTEEISDCGAIQEGKARWAATNDTAALRK